MYEGGFYSFDSLEEHGAYWSRYIYINRYMDTPKPAYENLYELVTDKDYFVLTTNADHCFQKAGVAKERLFYTQGDYGLFQCQTPLLYKMRDGRFMHQLRGSLCTRGNYKVLHLYRCKTLEKYENNYETTNSIALLIIMTILGAKEIWMETDAFK